MTRDEAEKKVRDAAPVWGSGDILVDSLVALGLLKLDEPKNAEDRFFECIYGRVSLVSSEVFNDTLKQMNLKIVEK